MDPSLYGLMVFAAVGSITPGPNNILLFVSGQHFGLRKTLPLMVGIQLGFWLLLLSSAWGISVALSARPQLQFLMKVVASTWLLYLAYRIFMMERLQGNSAPRIITFPQAFLMQFINPKAWTLCLNGAAAFMPKLATPLASITAFMFIFIIAGTISMFTWVAAGSTLARLFQSPRAHRILTTALALLLAASIFTVWS